jgi:uncharacterized protein (DUF433 family)
MPATSPLPPADSLVGAAEAAFIADLDAKDLHRVVDESVLPDVLWRRDDARRFARLGAALAKFYFDTADDLSKAVRVDVITKLVDRLVIRDNASDIFGLVGPSLSLVDWTVHLDYVVIDLRRAIEPATERAARARYAAQLVVEDPDVLGGRPTFRGSRVPIETVIGAPTTGPAWERLRASYPFLTADHIDAANIYSVIRPRRGRPAKKPPPKAWKLKRSRRIPSVGT